VTKATKRIDSVVDFVAKCIQTVVTSSKAVRDSRNKPRFMKEPLNDGGLGHDLNRRCKAGSQ